MRINKLLALASLLISSIFFNSSAIANSNNFYVELGGQGGLYSLNYERMFSDMIYGRVGLGFYNLNVHERNNNNIDSVNGKLILAPVMLNALFGESDHKFEAGAGVTIIHASLNANITDPEYDNLFGSNKVSEKGTGFLPTASLGYRYQPKDSGVMFRTTFTPMMASGNIVPWFGVSLGYSF